MAAGGIKGVTLVLVEIETTIGWAGVEVGGPIEGPHHQEDVHEAVRP